MSALQQTMRKPSAKSVSEDKLLHDKMSQDSSTEGSSLSDDEDVDIDERENGSESSPESSANRIIGEGVAKKSQPNEKAIAREIEDIFIQDLNSCGAFCFEKRYPAAPNPTLRLDRAGHIGLPVNSRDVLAIKEHFKPVKVESLATSKAEDIWKMKASKVAFDNPRWIVFMCSVILDVCKALAIKSDDSKPRYELQKLWFQGAGSTLSFKRENSSTAAFATLVITLPCAFTGGEAVISHEGTSRTIDQARNSLIFTSAMAWYSGLTPKFRPISNGHRLVLHYHLIHTTTSPGPSLSHPSKAIDRLGKVLTSWKTASFDRGTPRKIVHLLEHKYSDAKLTEDGLEGRDAYVISALKDTIAQKSGFKLLLAHVELSARGHASCGPRQKWGRRQYLHSGNGSGQEVVEGADPALLEFKDPLDVQYELKLLQLRELNGTPLRDRVNLDELKAVESIPGDLTAALKRGQPDLTEYTEGKNKSLTGSLFRSFRQSVLIICPSERYFAFIYDKVFSKDALGTLRSSASAVPTGKERILIECVLGTRDEYSKPELQDVLQVVTTCACRWGSFTIWYKAMDGCRGWEGIDRIQQKGLLSALLSLHFDNATQSVCRVMTNEKCQSERIQFAFAACRELKAKGLPTNWILKPLKKDIRTITDLGLSELDVLVRTIAGAGGIQAVDDFVLPALTKKSDPGRTVAVVRGLQQELDLEGNSLVPPEERGHAERTINMLLSSTINDWKPYAVEREEPKAVISGMFSFAPMVAIPPSADMAINLVKAATETKNVALIETLAGKLMAIPELGDYFQITPKEAFRSIILPTLKDITESSERGPPQASLEKVVRQLKRGLSNVALEQKGLCQHDLRTVIFPALAGQVDAEYIRDGLVPHFCKAQRNLLIYEAVCRQLGTWMNESSDQDFQKAIRQSIKHLLVTAANDRKSKYFHSMSSVEDVLKLCAELGVAEHSSYIFARVAEQVASLVVQRSSDFVISSLGQIGKWLAEQGYGPMYPSFPELARIVVTTWREKVLGPIPDGVGPLRATERISCACEDCAQVKSYLGYYSPREKRLDQIGWTRINHVVKVTIPHCRGVVSWDTINSKPQPSLSMRKSNETTQGLVWLKKKRAGLSALQQISNDEATLLQVLGQDEYRRVLVALHVDYVNAPLPTSRVQGEQVASATISRSTPIGPASSSDDRPAKRRKVGPA